MSAHGAFTAFRSATEVRSADSADATVSFPRGQTQPSAARRLGQPCPHHALDLILWGSITAFGLVRLSGWDHFRVIISVVYLLVRRLLDSFVVLARREMSKDAELLVLRHENAVLRR
jgi:hypothetical protein